MNSTTPYAIHLPRPNKDPAALYFKDLACALDTVRLFREGSCHPNAYLAVKGMTLMSTGRHYLLASAKERVLAYDFSKDEYVIWFPAEASDSYHGGHYTQSRIEAEANFATLTRTKTPHHPNA